MKKLFFPLFFLSLWQTCFSSIQLELAIKKGEYLENEQVAVILKITNRLGQKKVFLGNWLDFNIFDDRGKLIAPLNPANFHPLEIDAGETKIVPISLLDFYALGQGRHYVHAALRSGEIYGISNRIPFSIFSGRTVWETEIGNSAGILYRHQLIHFSSQKGAKLYFQVSNLSEGGVRTHFLGNFPIKSFEVEVDRKNQMHILYLLRANLYLYLSISPEGEIMGKRIYERKTFAPSLKLSKGKIFVLGELYSEKNKKKLRKLSELPEYLYK